MGEKSVLSGSDEARKRQFTSEVLADLEALEEMFRSGMLENDAMRIGAEQEMFLVDSSMRPAPIILDVLQKANDHRLTTEIAKFNIEANLTPRDFTGKCLSELESELYEVYSMIRTAAAQCGADAVMCGILPTIQLSDLVGSNLTPYPRYLELNRVLTELHGDQRLVHIKGLDELRMKVSDTFVEFCNTSFQIHIQAGCDNFSHRYNWAQAITAPVLASAVNSPLLTGHRLWQETRLALFQHAVDERSPTQHERNRPARVTFGTSWVNGSILELFREDAARFRVVLIKEIEENSLETLQNGGIPELAAWRMHNGTVWRWNRACYGVLNGKPGLRIEARFLPSGPTIIDEMANSALFLGLMTALPELYGDVRNRMQFDDAKTNFFSTARFGLQSQITWMDGKCRNARELLLEELIPAAEYGLNAAKVDPADIERYLGVIRERVRQSKTGSRWMLDSLAGMDKAAKRNVRMRTLTRSMILAQDSGKPLHEWDLAEIPPGSDWIDNYRTVEQFMTTDLYTVRPEDGLDLAASIMKWKHVRHIPVESGQGELVGIVSHRDLLEILTAEHTPPSSEMIVGEIMKKDPVAISPDTLTINALRMMRDLKIGCLPVVNEGKLVGLITAYDFLTVSTKLLEMRLEETAQLLENYNESSSSERGLDKPSEQVHGDEQGPSDEDRSLRVVA